MPYPFSKGVFIAGEPVIADKEAGSAELEKKRLELETKLNELTQRADRFFAERHSKDEG